MPFGTGKYPLKYCVKASKAFTLLGLFFILQVFQHISFCKFCAIFTIYTSTHSAPFRHSCYDFWHFSVVKLRDIFFLPFFPH